MTYIVRRCPYHQDAENADFVLGGETKAGTVGIPHHVLVVRVSLAIVKDDEQYLATTSFPAVVDTGFNGNFLLTRYHLENWANMKPEELGKQIKVPARIRGKYDAAVYAGRIWIRSNKPGSWEEGTRSPQRLDCDDGIFLFPKVPESEKEIAGMFPFPLIGTKAFNSPLLRLDVDAKRLCFSIKKLPIWPYGLK